MLVFPILNLAKKSLPTTFNMKNINNNITYAFIDSQNLNLGIKSQGWTLDWYKFRQYLKDKYKTAKAYLFIGYRAGNESLYTKLQENGFTLIFKPTLELPNGVVKGNVDAELVLHTMIEFKNYHTTTNFYAFLHQTNITHDYSKCILVI